jgi:hypothetical protein
LDLNCPSLPTPPQWCIRDQKIKGWNKKEGKINVLNVESLDTLRENVQNEKENIWKPFPYDF